MMSFRFLMLWWSLLFTVAHSNVLKTKQDYLVNDLPWIQNNLTSYAGLIPIRLSPTSSLGATSLFFWYFPARYSNHKKSLVTFLQGGPGSSSMISLFHEVGPLEIVSNRIKIRNNSWADYHDLLFIDNPVGTGFSQVERTLDCPFENKRNSVPDNLPIYCNGYAMNQQAVSKDLLEFFLQFYKLFPELHSMDLYLSGESYAGKYVPWLAHKIHENNRKKESMKHAQTFIPLKGIILGDALVNPIAQLLVLPDQYLNMGLVSPRQKKVLLKKVDQIVKYYHQNLFLEASKERIQFFELLDKFSGDINYYDIRKRNQKNDWTLMNEFLARENIIKSLNLPQGTRFSNRDVHVKYALQQEDIIKSSHHIVEKLLSLNYKVLVYAGQFDMRDGITSQYAWLLKLNWNGRNAFSKSKREIWKLNEKVVGYKTIYKNLQFYELNMAGHLAPMDQRFTCYTMLQEFTSSH